MDAVVTIKLSVSRTNLAVEAMTEVADKEEQEARMATGAERRNRAQRAAELREIIKSIKG